MNQHKFLTIVILSLTLFSIKGNQFYSFVCNENIALEGASESLNACYKEFFEAAELKNYNPVFTDIRGLFLPYIRNYSTYLKQGNFYYTPLNPNNDNLTKIRQDFFNDVIFWYLTLSAPISKGDIKRTNVIDTHKIALRLMMLGAINGIRYSDKDNQALISSIILNSNEGMLHESNGWYFPTASFISREGMTAFSFIETIDNYAINSLLTINDKSGNEENIYQEFIAEADKAKSSEVSFGMYSSGNWMCPIEVDNDIKQEQIAPQKNAGKIINKLIQNNIKKLSGQTYQSTKYSLEGYFGGTNTYFEDIQKNSGHINDIHPAYAKLDLYSNVDQVKDIQNPLDKKVASKSINEVILTNVKRLNESENTYGRENSQPVTLSCSWFELKRYFNSWSMACPGRLGSISVRVRNPYEEIKSIFRAADKFYDSIQSQDNNINNNLHTLFNLLASEEPSHRQNVAYKIWNNFDLEGDESYINRFSNRLISEHEIPFTYKPIYNPINDNLTNPQTAQRNINQEQNEAYDQKDKEVFKNVYNYENLNQQQSSQTYDIKSFISDPVIVKKLNEAVKGIMHLEHKIIKQIVRLNVSVLKPSYNTLLEQSNDCYKLFQTYKDKDHFIMYNSDYPIDISKYYSGIKKSNKIDKLNKKANDIRNILTEIKAKASQNMISVVSDYLNYFAFWAQVASLDFEKEFYDLDVTELSQIIAGLKNRKLKDFSNIFSRIFSKAITKNSTQNKHINKFLPEFNSCILGDNYHQLII